MKNIFYKNNLKKKILLKNILKKIFYKNKVTIQFILYKYKKDIFNIYIKKYRII